MDSLVCGFYWKFAESIMATAVTKVWDSARTCSNTGYEVTSESAGICCSNDMMVDFVSLFELQKSCCPLDICCHPFCLAIYSMYNFLMPRGSDREMDGTISELNGAGQLDLL